MPNSNHVGQDRNRHSALFRLFSQQKTRYNVMLVWYPAPSEEDENIISKMYSCLSGDWLREKTYACPKHRIILVAPDQCFCGTEPIVFNAAGAITNETEKQKRARLKKYEN